jgi:hypothetical protein
LLASRVASCKQDFNMVDVNEFFRDVVKLEQEWKYYKIDFNFDNIELLEEMHKKDQIAYLFMEKNVPNPIGLFTHKEELKRYLISNGFNCSIEGLDKIWEMFTENKGRK